MFCNLRQAGNLGEWSGNHLWQTPRWRLRSFLQPDKRSEQLPNIQCIRIIRHPHNPQNLDRLSAGLLFQFRYLRNLWTAEPESHADFNISFLSRIQCRFLLYRRPNRPQGDSNLHLLDEAISKSHWASSYDPRLKFFIKQRYFDSQ